MLFRQPGPLLSFLEFFVAAFIIVIIFAKFHKNSGELQSEKISENLTPEERIKKAIEILAKNRTEKNINYLLNNSSPEKTSDFEIKYSESIGDEAKNLIDGKQIDVNEKYIFQGKSFQLIAYNLQQRVDYIGRDDTAYMYKDGKFMLVFNGGVVLQSNISKYSGDYTNYQQKCENDYSLEAFANGDWLVALTQMINYIEKMKMEESESRSREASKNKAKNISL